jgi:hypothetical protein
VFEAGCLLDVILGWSADFDRVGSRCTMLRTITRVWSLGMGLE